MALDPSLVLELVSGLGLVTIGVLLFFVRTRRAYTMVFAFFVILWGALIVSATVSRGALTLGATRIGRLALLVHVALLVDAYLPLAYFASVYPVRHGLARSWGGVAALAVPAVLGNVGLVVAITGFHRSVLGPSVEFAAQGPLYHIYSALFFAAFLYAISSMYRYHERVGHDLERRRAIYILAALILFVGFEGAQRIVRADVLRLLAWPSGPGLEGLVDLLVGGIAVLVAGGTGLALAARRTTGSAGQRVVALLAAVAAIGAGVTAQRWSAELGLQAGSVWRLVAVALLAYAFIRFETFDVEVKVARGAVGASVFGAAVVGAFGLYQVLLDAVGSVPMATGIAQAVLFGVLAVAVLSSRDRSGLLGRLLDRLSAPRKLEERRFEVYEAALARAVASGRLEADRSFLEDLRRRLGISRAGHEVMVRLVEGPASAGEAPAVGDRLGDRYRIEGELDEGGSGQVLEAVDERGQRRVVVKLLKLPGPDRESAIRDFVREAHLASRIDHPHVVGILDMGVAGDRPYLVQEHVAGGSLAEYVGEGSPLPVGEATRIASEILDGLSAIHEQGIVHRDLKPANVLLTADGRVKIADFGVAIRVDPSATARGLSDVDEAAGTPMTMSPEVAAGKAATPRSDVYAVGAILYEMLTGEPYIDLSGTSRQMMRRIRTATPRSFPVHVPDDLIPVVLKALSKRPDERFASADAMRDALRDAEL